ncbi:MAG: hypothetical protein RLY21_218 [Planctomycetota bacterium]|jgi:hypothetical protein
MPDPASTTSVTIGFPVELRPLLVLVIVLAIAHTALRMRVRKGRPAQRLAQRRPVQHGMAQHGMVQHPREPAPMKVDLPPEPAEALAALRRRADDEAQRP